jgi:hypothetical protein
LSSAANVDAALAAWGSDDFALDAAALALTAVLGVAFCVRTLLGGGALVLTLADFGLVPALTVVAFSVLTVDFFAGFGFAAPAGFLAAFFNGFELDVGFDIPALVLAPLEFASPVVFTDGGLALAEV